MVSNALSRDIVHMRYCEFSLDGHKPDAVAIKRSDYGPERANIRDESRKKSICGFKKAYRIRNHAKILPDAMILLGQFGGVTGQFRLKPYFSTKYLVVGIHAPLLHYRFIAQIIESLQHQQSTH